MSKETLSPASLARPMILDILAASLKKDKAFVLWYCRIASSIIYVLVEEFSLLKSLKWLTWQPHRDCPWKWVSSQTRPSWPSPRSHWFPEEKTLAPCNLFSLQLSKEKAKCFYEECQTVNQLVKDLKHTSLVRIQRGILCGAAEVDEDVSVSGDLHNLWKLHGQPGRLVEVRHWQDLHSTRRYQNFRLVNVGALKQFLPLGENKSKWLFRICLF